MFKNVSLIILKLLTGFELISNGNIEQHSWPWVAIMHIFVLACTTGLSDVISITVDLTVCNETYQPLCGTPAI